MSNKHIDWSTVNVISGDFLYGLPIAGPRWLRYCSIGVRMHGLGGTVFRKSNLWKIGALSRVEPKTQTMPYYYASSKLWVMTIPGQPHICV